MKYLTAITLLLLWAGNARGDLIPLEDFAALPKFDRPALSPDGKRIAVTMTLKGEPMLVVQKLNTNPNEKREKPAFIRMGELYYE